MSITFTKAYVANGKTFATLREAQVEGIICILGDTKQLANYESSFDTIASVITGNAEKVVEILSMKETSRPSARKSNGGRKPRKNRVTEPVQTTSA